MSKRTCTRCGAELDLTDKFFPRSSSTKSGFESTCKLCKYGESSRPQRHQEHVRRRRYERPPAKQSGLKCECAGLPHRRPKRGCPECGGPYIPLAPVTSRDAEQLARTDRTVFPEGGA